MGRGVSVDFTYWVGNLEWVWFSDSRVYLFLKFYVWGSFWVTIDGCGKVLVVDIIARKLAEGFVQDMNLCFLLNGY